MCARIKEELLSQFNLHTVVRLPNGVFSPYTNINTNLLFFDTEGPTKTIWFYEQPLPEGRNNYTKTKPLTYEEFEACEAWFRAKPRLESQHAWSVEVADVIEYDADGNLLSVDLDIKNPNSQEALAHLPPSELTQAILDEEEKLVDIVRSIRDALEAK